MAEVVYRGDLDEKWKEKKKKITHRDKYYYEYKKDNNRDRSSDR